MRIFFMFVLTIFSLGGCAAREAEPETAPAFEEILKIDIHAHIFEYIPGFAELLSRNKLRLLNICVPASDPVQMKWMEETAELLHQKYGSIHPFASTFPTRHGVQYPQLSSMKNSMKAWTTSRM